MGCAANMGDELSEADDGLLRRNTTGKVTAQSFLDQAGVKFEFTEPATDRRTSHTTSTAVWLRL